MLFEKEKYIVTNEDTFYDFLEYDKNRVYLYHFIIVRYKEYNKIKELKIDQIKDLNILNDKKIIYKYYIRKVHYYTQAGYFFDDEFGDLYHIYNIGYFHIGGLFDTKKDELEVIKKLYDEYHDNYSNLNLEFSDEEFLSNNKSVNLF